MGVPQVLRMSDIARLARKADGKSRPSRQAIDNKVRRGQFPPPDYEIGLHGIPGWSPETVEKWLSERERKMWG